MEDEPTISTHVLDVETGQPAAGIVVNLMRAIGLDDVDFWSGTTDEDGRIRRLLDGPLLAGDYSITFRAEGRFFREISVTFEVTDTTRSYHVPLLLAPYSLATYRGS